MPFRQQEAKLYTVARATKENSPGDRIRAKNETEEKTMTDPANEKAKKTDVRVLTKYIPFLREPDDRLLSLMIYDIDYFMFENKELRLNRYHEIMNKQGIQWNHDSMTKADVTKLDFITVLALIVAAYRADHFCEGAFEDFVREGHVERWLKQVDKMTEWTFDLEP